MSTDGNRAPAQLPQAVIMQMAMGSWIARVISEISRMDIPDALKRGGPQTAGELIAGGVEANEMALQRVLRACAGFGLVTESVDGKFGPTELSEVLTTDSPVSVKVIAEEVAGTWLKSWGELGESIRTGGPVAKIVFGMEWWDYLNSNPVELERFGESMKSNSLNSLRGVKEKCDFSGSKRIVDVAGGFGHMVVALLEKYPHLEGVLIDIPQLIPVAKQKNTIADPSVAARLNYVGGDMFEKVPSGDVYILKHIMHDWTDELCIRILKNCHQSMEGDGRLICVDAVLPPMGDSSSVSGKLLDLLMMLSIRGKERTREEWEQLYAASGFRVVGITPLDDNFGTSIVEGAKA
jgi:hypothetical protein